MIGSINPEGERIRAQAILRSFTEAKEASDLFAPVSSQVETAALAANGNCNDGQFTKRILKAIKLNRRAAVDKSLRQSASSPRQVTPSGCSQ